MKWNEPGHHSPVHNVLNWATVVLLRRLAAWFACVTIDNINNSHIVFSFTKLYIIVWSSSQFISIFLPSHRCLCSVTGGNRVVFIVVSGDITGCFESNGFHVKVCAFLFFANVQISPTCASSEKCTSVIGLIDSAVGIGFRPPVCSL